MGFGTKSLPESILKEHNNLSLISDMHAEMLAIQAFKKFILKELSSGNMEWFDWCDKKKKFKLKSKFQVFLYCS